MTFDVIYTWLFCMIRRIGIVHKIKAPNDVSISGRVMGVEPTRGTFQNSSTASNVSTSSELQATGRGKHPLTSETIKNILL